MELDVDPAIISRHLSRIGKVKKLDKRVLHEFNENQTNCRYEPFSALLLRKKKSVA
jgi:hypothetical protein